MSQIVEKNPNRDTWKFISLNNLEDELVRDSNGEICSIWSLEWFDLKHAQDWYNEFARKIGFSIRIHSGTYIPSTKEWKIRTWVCNKAGHRKESNKDLQRERAQTRCGCQAIFSVQRQINGKWWTWNWNARHVHPLISPSKAHLLKSQKQIDDFHQLLCGNADDVGIQPRLAHELMAIQAGGKERLGFTHKDLKNRIQQRRNETFDVDALQAIMNYFGGKENDSKYFFKMQLDEPRMIENIFWSDHVIENDYLVFGDFVSFDITYRTNMENMPLGVFVGVNHHREQIVFGACLLYSETMASFEWVFQTFLQCMNGKSPQSFFTDQDVSMLAAIPNVFTDTKHYLCAWHINQNAMKNLGPRFGNKEFRSAWSSLLWSSDILDFDNAWFKMIVDNNLQENEWLQRIYSRRHMWAPVFVRNSFCAGKRTTQMIESFNSRQRSYLKSNMDLGRFFLQFQRAVDFLRYNELESNFHMQNELLNKKFLDPLCKHALKVYTPKILKFFHEEVMKSDWVRLDKPVDQSEVYVLHTCEESHDCSYDNYHAVTRGPQFYVCTSKNFNFIGIICCHIIWVLRRTGTGFVSQILDEYILPRWTRDARKTSVSPNTTTEDPEFDAAVKYRRYINDFANSISSLVSTPAACDIIEQTLVTLNSSLKNLLIDARNKVDDSQDVSDVMMIDGQEVLVKGKKKRESKFKGNKRPKSFLETKKKSSRNRKGSTEDLVCSSAPH